MEMSNKALRERVAELEADVARREARCAAYVKDLRRLARELRDLTESVAPSDMRAVEWCAEQAERAAASPDLAAARLLAEARLGRATYTLKHQNVIDTPAAEIPAADEEFAAAGEALEVAYREAVAAEEKADE